MRKLGASPVGQGLTGRVHRKGTVLRDQAKSAASKKDEQLRWRCPSIQQVSAMVEFSIPRSGLKGLVRRNRALVALSSDTPLSPLPIA
jgi:hypothetical protein